MMFLRAFVLFTLLLGAPSAFAHEIKAGDLLISKLWTRATPGGAKVAGGYITIENKGASADRLVSASSPDRRQGRGP